MESRSGNGQHGEAGGSDNEESIPPRPPVKRQQAPGPDEVDSSQNNEHGIPTLTNGHHHFHQNGTSLLNGSHGGFNGIGPEEVPESHSNMLNHNGSEGRKEKSHQKRPHTLHLEKEAKPAVNTDIPSQDCDLGYDDDFCDEPTVVDRVLNGFDAGFVNGDSVETPSESRDDMDRYLDENRHMLQQDSSSGNQLDAMNEYVLQTDLNESFEDHGDFIETDIPKALCSYNSSANGSGNTSHDSATSSYEDLPSILAELGEQRGINLSESVNQTTQANCDAQPVPDSENPQPNCDNFGHPQTHNSSSDQRSNDTPNFPCSRITNADESHSALAQRLSSMSVRQDANDLRERTSREVLICDDSQGVSFIHTAPLQQYLNNFSSSELASESAQSEDSMMRLDCDGRQTVPRDCVSNGPRRSLLPCNNDLVNRDLALTCPVNDLASTEQPSTSHTESYVLPPCSVPCTSPALSSNEASNMLSVGCTPSGSVPRASVSSETGTWGSSELCNESRKTSTSNFEQDDSSLQGSDDLDTECFECQRNQSSASSDYNNHSAMSSSLSAGRLNHSASSHQSRAPLRSRYSLDLEPSHSLGHSLSWSSPPLGLPSPGSNLSMGAGVAASSRTMSLPLSLSAEVARGAGIGDLYDPGSVNMQWLQHMTKSLDEDFLTLVLQQQTHPSNDKSEGRATSKQKASTENKSATMPPSLRPQHRDHLLLYTRFLRDYLLTQLQDPHHSWWYQPSAEEERDIPRVMLWTEFQAYCTAVSQIGTSACGATAVFNVLKVFELQADVDTVCRHVPTRVRAECAPVGEYLLSRSVAGTTAEALVSGIEQITQGQIAGRFFCFYPQRAVGLRQWLASWMKQGAVAIITLNLQQGIAAGQDIPDSWHHQMIYGVSPKGVYLTNPQQLVPEHVINAQLCSASVLLIRRQDVVGRWDCSTDLSVLATHTDPRWHELNVLGQVVHMLREERLSHQSPGSASQAIQPHLTSHVTIPAIYKPGISLFVRRNCSLYNKLMAEPELPTVPPAKQYLETDIF